MGNLEVVQTAMDMLYTYCEEHGIGIHATIVFYVGEQTMVEQVNNIIEENNY